jgi:selenocysteine lyase/cysteine desulfurase
VRSLGHFFNPQQSLADRLGLAGASYELLQSIPLVIEYLGGRDSDRWQDVVEHEEKLQEALLSYLRDRPDVTIYGHRESDPARRVPTVSFTIQGWDSKEVVETVEAQTNYAFRWGAFYSERLVRDVLSLGPHGVVRVSMVHYNTRKSILACVYDSILTLLQSTRSRVLFKRFKSICHNGPDHELTTFNYPQLLRHPKELSNKD